MAQSTISMIQSTITNYVYFSLFQNILSFSVNLLLNSKKMTKVASTFPVIGGERHSNIMPTCTKSCKYISQMVNWAIKKSMNFWEKITCQQYLRSQYDSATPKRSMKISMQFSFTHTKQYQSLLDKLNGYMEISM